MGNSIICPVTAIPMIVAMGVTAFYSFRKGKKIFTQDKILPTVALTSLVFAMQMINFSTGMGASGHIIGGMLLAIVLGQNIGFLAMAMILLLQSLLFSDGSIMAYGFNLFNMGFIPCYVVYPIVYKFLENQNKKTLGIILSSFIAVQLGAFAVVCEAAFSNSSINFNTFAFFMQTQHVFVGLIEGLFTAIVTNLVSKYSHNKNYYISLFFVVFCLIGIVTNFSSSKPDGLEWSLIKLSDNFVISSQTYFVNILNLIQQKTSILLTVNNSLANLIGLFVLMLSMFSLSKFLMKKEIKVDFHE
jgi:cobalt/nickel transport system permease protein